jgi:hypothetical protein
MWLLHVNWDVIVLDLLQSLFFIHLSSVCLKNRPFGTKGDMLDNWMVTVTSEEKPSVMIT